MNFFDGLLKKIFNFFKFFINFLKKITRIEIIKKIEKFTENIFSTTLIISCFSVFIIGLIFYGKTQIGWVLPLVIFGPIIILFIAFLANDFHEACADLIKSNTTTLSNNAILRFFAIVSLIFAFIAMISAIISIFNASLMFTVWSLLSFLFFFISAGTLFNPSLLNIVINKKSSAGEDLIAIFSLNLKSLVFFEKITTTILIVLGNIFLIANLVTQKLVFFFSGLGFLFSGIAFPILIYFTFTILWFFNSVFLAILSLGRKK